MSRIGKLPVIIPQGVEVKIEGQTVTAKGPNGTETVTVRPEISVKMEDNHIILTKIGDSKETDNVCKNIFPANVFIRHFWIVIFMGYQFSLKQ